MRVLSRHILIMYIRIKRKDIYPFTILKFYQLFTEQNRMMYTADAASSITNFCLSTALVLISVYALIGRGIADIRISAYPEKIPNYN